MPRLMELQRRQLPSQTATRAEYQTWIGEETLVLDVRCRMRPAQQVEERLRRLLARGNKKRGG